MHPDELIVANCCGWRRDPLGDLRQCNALLCDPATGDNARWLHLSGADIPAPAYRKADGRVMCARCAPLETPVSSFIGERRDARHVSRKALVEDAGPWGDIALRHGEGSE